MVRGTPPPPEAVQASQTKDLKVKMSAALTAMTPRTLSLWIRGCSDVSNEHEGGQRIKGSTGYVLPQEAGWGWEGLRSLLKNGNCQVSL